MTDGEKMIWAAAFAKKLDLNSHAYTQVDHNNRHASETAEAVFAAYEAVTYARESFGYVGRDYHKDVANMLKEMIE